MDILRQRILKEGRCLDGGILKVDSFVNHQLDPQLVMLIGEEFEQRFAHLHINKIITVEASGIAPALMTGFRMKLPVVFAKKKQPSTMVAGFYQTEVTSFTKHRSYPMIISKEYLKPGENILFIDDFLAHGNAARGIIDICQQAGATIAGMGFMVEKSFQQGGHWLRERGYLVESLAIIDSLEGNRITLR